MFVKRIVKFRQTPKRVDFEGTNYRAKSFKKKYFYGLYLPHYQTVNQCSLRNILLSDPENQFRKYLKLMVLLCSCEETYAMPLYFLQRGKGVPEATNLHPAY